MIVLESGHYYQVRITSHPQESHRSLEAVNSMLPASAALPEGPTPLPRDQLPDPMTAIMSGEAGTWQLGNAPYCLWRWAQRRWPHTRDWTATWRFHLDGWQQLEAIPQRERMAETPQRPTCAPSSQSTRSGRWRWAGNCSPPSVLRQKPKQHTQPLCTKSSVPSAAPLCGV